MTALYLQNRRAEDVQNPVKEAIWIGVDAYFDLAVILGATYQPDMSNGLFSAKASNARGQLNATFEERIEQLGDRLLSIVNAELDHRLPDIHTAYSEEFSLAQEMAARGLDQAQAEASDAQRRVDVLERQLKLSGQQVTKLEYDIRKVKESAQKPSAETLALRERVTLLERQNKQLAVQLSQQSRKDSQPEVTEMPEPTAANFSASFPTTLEAMAFCAYARQTFAPAAMLLGSRNVTASTSVSLEAALRGYQTDVGSPREYLRSLPSVQACMMPAGLSQSPDAPSRLAS